MIKPLKVLFAACVIFLVFSFLLTNINTLNLPITFRFEVPHVFQTDAYDIPAGYFFLITFCAGMLVAALMGGLSIFYRSQELKAKSRAIRELEKEVEELRTIRSTEFKYSPSSSPAPQTESPASLNDAEL